MNNYTKGVGMKIAVVGVGSAGVLTICHLLNHLPIPWEVVSVYNPTKKILGIGESTNPPFINTIELATGFNILKDGHHLDATIKLGTVYKDWREHDVIGPLISGTCAIHFNNFKFKDFIFGRLKERHTRFSELHGDVSSMETRNNKAILNIDGVDHEFDYVVDCTGFPKDYSDYTMMKLPINHCLVHNKDVPGDWMYTGHKAHKNGWLFEVPLTNRQSYGYLYNDTITDIDDAKKDFSEIIDVPVDQLQDIEYKFKPYYANKMIDGRIFKNGNKAVFLEPISATSLYVYTLVNDLMIAHINGRSANEINYIFREKAQWVVEMIGYFYHGGSTYQSDFWTFATELGKEHIQHSNIFKRVVEDYKVHHARGLPHHGISWIFATQAFKIFDKEFGYNYLP